MTSKQPRSEKLLLTVVSWRDNRSVTLISNDMETSTVTEFNQWYHKKKVYGRVKRPAIISEYNKDMVGVD